MDTLIAPLSTRWFAARSGADAQFPDIQITATKAAVAAGLSKYATPESLRQRLCCAFAEQAGSADMTRGRVLEPYALAEYEVGTGNSVAAANLWVSTDQPWLAATPDGIVYDDVLTGRPRTRVSIEAKAPRCLPVAPRSSWLGQLMTQMAVIGGAYGDFVFYTHADYEAAETAACAAVQRGLLGRCPTDDAVVALHEDVWAGTHYVSPAQPVCAMWRVAYCDDTWDWMARRLAALRAAVAARTRCTTRTVCYEVTDALERLVVQRGASDSVVLVRDADDFPVPPFTPLDPRVRHAGLRGERWRASA